MSWTIVYTNQALQDKYQLEKQGLSIVLEKAMNTLRLDPYTDGIALIGDLAGVYSKTVIASHCVIYQIIVPQRIIKVVGVI